jgi:hypothetical protein
MSEKADKGRIKYTYGGVVFIYCPIRNKEITSYPSSDKTGDLTGTKFSKPILLDKADCSWVDLQQADLANYLRRRPTKWTSHSVLVIDMSGSMRRDDVNGARCRSDGVFLALARDYVKAPLDKKERGATDLISIVIMREEADVLIEHEPMTYVLYNKIVDLRDWDRLRPAGPGNYLPAIEAAEKLLTTNASAGCALSLLFFSDGSPSDKGGDFTSSIGDLASKFGRRLSLACIGMADRKEDFTVLSDMVNEAKSYGSQATFGRPSLDSESLASLVSSLASSVTSTKSEMTEAKSGKCKSVQNVTREKIDASDNEGEWYYYENEKHFRVVSVSTWQYKKNQYIKLIDPRCAICYAHVGYEVSVTKGIVCGRCNAYCVCYSCQKNYSDDRDYLMKMHRAKRAGKSSSVCTSNLYKVANGELIMKRLPSFFIAFKEKIFSEGAERMVRKVRFIGSDGCFTGDRYVAKESRFIGEDHNDVYLFIFRVIALTLSSFVENNENKKQQRDYHVNFMRTQNISADFAKQFNEALDNIHTHFHELPSNLKRALDNLPRIEFIEPMVVEVTEGGKRKCFLIEKLLNGEYKKFNSNNGYICSDAREGKGEDDLARNMNNNLNLGAIEEGDEDEESDEESIEDDEVDITDRLFDERESAPISGRYNLHSLKSSHIPQAFSHFSYVKSRRTLIVVDLQGVLTVSKQGGNMFELTDPVIHRRDKKAGRQWDFGRTDRGKAGINAFFRTHQCSEMCKLLGLEKESFI